jgi:hypothetical protein
MAKLTMLTIKICPPMGEENQFSDFLLREASRATFSKEGNQWTIPVHDALDAFHLGANWHLYKSQGYSFNKPRRVHIRIAMMNYRLEQFRQFIAEQSSGSLTLTPVTIVEEHPCALPANASADSGQTIVVLEAEETWHFFHLGMEWADAQRGGATS